MMKLDRSINGTGRGKYGLINNRRLADLTDLKKFPPMTSAARADVRGVSEALALLERAGVIEWGEPGTAGEFFVIKLRDKHACRALFAYAQSIGAEDKEYIEDVLELSSRAGPHSPFCKTPD
jgi:hypothetical protein